MDAFNEVLMFLGSTVCHQLAERSYFLGTVQMPLCARCIGIHFGFFLSAAYILLGPKRNISKLPSIRQLVLLCSIMAFYFLDAGLSYSGISQSDNLRRTLSGLALGIPLPFLLMSILGVLTRQGGSQIGVLEKPQDWLALPILYGLALGSILLAPDFGPLFYAVSIIGVVGVFVFFTTVISVAVVAVFDKSQYSFRAKVIISAVLAFAVLMILAVLNRAFSSG